MMIWVAFATFLAQSASAQTGSTSAFQAARAKHLAVSSSERSVPEDFRQAINTYDELIRRDPTGRHVPDALWQAADLANEAYRRFGDHRDRLSAQQLFQRLVTQYPNNWLAPAAAAELARISDGDLAPVLVDGDRPTRPPLRGGSPSASMRESPSRAQYHAARALHKDVSASTTSKPAEFRDVIETYRNMVRLHPTDNYAPEALWQAADVAAEAFRRFGEDRDRLVARQLLHRLAREYPSSWLAPAAANELGIRVVRERTRLRGGRAVEPTVPNERTRAALPDAAVLAARSTSATASSSTSLVAKAAQPLSAAKSMTDTEDHSAVRWDTSDVAAWRVFRVTKPREPSSSRTETNAMRRKPQLPAQKDILRTDVGVGHVWGQDWGMEVGTSGRFRGIDTEISSFLTAGRSGVEAPMARVALRDPQGAWGTEVGDLMTELRGLARGVRFSWKSGERHHPTVSLYVPSVRLNDSSTTLAFRDNIRLFRHVSVGGEVATDQSYSLGAAYVHGRVDLQGNYRRLQGDDPARDSALMGSYRLWGGVSFQAGVRNFDTSTERGRTRLMALRVPVGRFFDLTFEDNRTISRDSTDVSNAILFQLRRGPVILTQRYQWGDSQYLRLGGPFGIEQRQLQTTGSFSPARWATLSLQTATQWLEDGRAQQWQEVHAGLDLSRKTRLQLYSPLPDLFDKTRFRGRLTQDLPKELALLVDFGRVSAFQGALIRESEPPRVSVMLRKRWRVSTPARGGDVTGQIVDDLGNAVSGAGVRLGPYLAFTDQNGRYNFPRVPHGDFQLGVANDFLPAHYASDGSVHHLKMNGTERRIVNLVAIPLNSITGHVYQDINGNGRFDSGEGRPKVVLQLDAQVTATDAEGAYGFYNLAPGDYTIRLDLERLDKAYAASSETQRAAELVPGRPSIGIDFRLVYRQKPVILRQGTK